jgi:hypothetical protein
MKKVIKLTESDLMNIVKRVIKEQSSSLETKLRDSGFVDASNTGGKKVLVKKSNGKGSFFFEFKNNGCLINVLNPNENTIARLELKLKGKNKNGTWYTKGFHPEVECERLAEYINTLIGVNSTQQSVVDTPTTIDEDRMDFLGMSDEELHDLHPHIKKHPKHFKDFKPTSEYLGWRGEVDKRNLYKSRGKFHDAFDKKTED